MANMTSLLGNFTRLKVLENNNWIIYWINITHFKLPAYVISISLTIEIHRNNIATSRSTNKHIK